MGSNVNILPRILSQFPLVMEGIHGRIAQEGNHRQEELMTYILS